MPITAHEAITRAAGITGTHPVLHWDLHERRRQLAIESSNRAMSGIATYTSQMADASANMDRITDVDTVTRKRWRSREPRSVWAKMNKRRPALNASDIFEVNHKMDPISTHHARAMVMEEEDFWADMEEDPFCDDLATVTDDGSWTPDVSSSSSSDSDSEWESVAAFDPIVDSSETGWEVVESAVPSFADVLRRSSKCSSNASKATDTTDNSLVGTKAPVLANVKRGISNEEEDDFLYDVYDDRKMQRGGKAKHRFKRERKK